MPPSSPPSSPFLFYFVFRLCTFVSCSEYQLILFPSDEGREPGRLPLRGEYSLLWLTEREGFDPQVASPFKADHLTTKPFPPIIEEQNSFKIKGANLKKKKTLLFKKNRKVSYIGASPFISAPLCLNDFLNKKNKTQPISHSY